MGARPPSWAGHLAGAASEFATGYSGIQLFTSAKCGIPLDIWNSNSDIPLNQERNAEYRMPTILTIIGDQLRNGRRARGLSQAQLALRIGRDPARISELERELKANRMGRDRLTLVADICDALDLVPVLVPRSRAGEIRMIVEGGRAAPATSEILSPFDELFVDLNEQQTS